LKKRTIVKDRTYLQDFFLLSSQIRLTKSDLCGAQVLTVIVLYQLPNFNQKICLIRKRKRLMTPVVIEKNCENGGYYKKMYDRHLTPEANYF
jgi:hypothetical protein